MTCWVLQSRACRESACACHICPSRNAGREGGKPSENESILLHWEQLSPSGDVWHCLETYLVVKYGGRGGASGS